MTKSSLEQQRGAGYITLLHRFVGYLSGDSLTYLLGFVIYAWLVRVLTNQSFGYLGVSTSIYQIFMMIVALGIDLVGPRLIADHPEHARSIIRSIELVRVKLAILFCLPAMMAMAVWYCRAGRTELAVIILASFSMVLARAFDISYVAVAFSCPGLLAKSRIFGMAVYLLALVLGKSLLAQHIWTIPVLNAIAVTIGRMDLKRRMDVRLPKPAITERYLTSELRILSRGGITGVGQLLLLALQSGDVIILGRYISPDVVGQYAIVSRLYLFGTAVLTSALVASLPDIVKAVHCFAELKNSVRKLVVISSAVGVLGAVAFATLGPRLIEIFAHRKLDKIALFTPVFSLAFVSLAVVNPFLSLLPSIHREREYLIGIAFSAAAVFAVDLYCIPRFGPVCAAYSLLFGTVLLGLFSATVFFRHLRKNMVDQFALSVNAAAD
jgi:O-antigen/teichoic acid export membrane protein